MPEIKNIVKKYDDKVVFDNLNVTFSKDKVTAIMGASGMGKTTLINVVCKLTEFEGELIGFDDNVSYVFQTNRLIPTLSVIKNVEYAISSAYNDKNERKKIALKYLQFAKIEKLANSKTKELSGGEQQRVQLARAFAYPSTTLLMDEPFSSLDLSLKKQLIDLCADLLEKNPRTVLFVTHDVDEALSFADSVIVLKGPSEYDRFEIPFSNKDRDLSCEPINDVRKQIYNSLLCK